MAASAPVKSSASTGFAALVTRSASAASRRKALQPSGKRWHPHGYQKKGAAFLVSRAAAALLMDPGLGKTSISYAALLLLKKAGLLKGALVVAPRRPAVSTWPGEQQEWSDFHGLKVVVLHGDAKDKRVLERADVYVVNYEGLPWRDAFLNTAMILGGMGPVDAPRTDGGKVVGGL